MHIRLLILCISFGLTAHSQELFTPEWTKYYTAGQYGQYGQLFANGIVIDSEENVYIAFWAFTDVMLDTLPLELSGDNFGVIAKFTKEGELLWASEYSDPYSEYGSVTFRDLKIDHNDDLIIAGTTLGSLVYRGNTYIDTPSFFLSGFIQKINSNGDNIYFHSFDSTFIYDLAIGPNNEISGIASHFPISGTFLGEVVDSAFLLFSCNADLELNFLLQQQVPFKKDHNDDLFPSYYPRISVNQNNEIFVAYNYADTMNLNGNVYLHHNYYQIVIDSYMVDYDSFVVYIDTFYQVSADGVIVKYDTSGNELWNCTIEGGYTQYYNTLEIDDFGNAYAMGIFYQGDTIFIKDSTLLIYPDDLPDDKYPYIILKIDLEGNPVNYTFSEDSILFSSDFVLAADKLYVPGYIHTDELNWRGAALGRYDLDFNLNQFGQATCAYVSPCPSQSNIKYLAIGDSSIYVLGYIYKNGRWGTDTIDLQVNGYVYFLSKLPYDFSDPYILPEELTTDYNENAIYPVPVNNVIHISFTDYDAEIENCLITNSLGQQWQFATKKNNLNNWEVDVHHLRRGVYFISYSINDKTYSHTFIKM